MGGGRNILLWRIKRVRGAEEDGGRRGGVGGGEGEGGERDKKEERRERWMNSAMRAHCATPPADSPFPLPASPFPPSFHPSTLPISLHRSHNGGPVCS